MLRELKESGLNTRGVEMRKSSKIQGVKEKKAMAEKREQKKTTKTKNMNTKTRNNDVAAEGVMAPRSATATLLPKEETSMIETELLNERTVRVWKAKDIVISSTCPCPDAACDAVVRIGEYALLAPHGSWECVHCRKSGGKGTDKAWASESRLRTHVNTRACRNAALDATEGSVDEE